MGVVPLMFSAALNNNRSPSKAKYQPSNGRGAARRLQASLSTLQVVLFPRLQLGTFQSVSRPFAVSCSERQRFSVSVTVNVTFPSFNTCSPPLACSPPQLFSFTGQISGAGGHFSIRISLRRRSPAGCCCCCCCCLSLTVNKPCEEIRTNKVSPRSLEPIGCCFRSFKSFKSRRRCVVSIKGVVSNDSSVVPGGAKGGGA